MMVEFLKGLSFFILPLGFGRKRAEFFESQVRRFGGALGEGAGTHVVVEDSVAADKVKCLCGLRSGGLEGRRDVVYVRVEWLSRCLRDRRVVERRPFEIEWLKDEAGECSAAASGGGSAEDGRGGDGESPEKRRKIEGEVGGVGGDGRIEGFGGDEVTFEKYACSKPSSSKCGETPQKRKIIEELEKLMNAYSIRNDTWRSHGYRKAINAISLYEKDISSFEEARSIPGVGEKMASKIMEIIECGKLEKVSEIVDEKTKVLDAFCKIWGVGPSTADGWYVQGFRTLEDLRTKAKLTKQQRIGLELYDELQRRIPREEVLQIGGIVESEVKKISDDLAVEIVGSFRRGKPTCGDADFMIVNPGTKAPLEILLRTTEALKTKGYLSHDLVTLEDSDDADEHHHKKYLGVFKLPGGKETHRRIDLFVVPKSEYAPALMHYTGSALFNRSIKLLAAKKNMTLTEHGLYVGTVRKGSEVTCKGQLVPTLSEEDIFSELGLPYRHPEERDH